MYLYLLEYKKAPLSPRTCIVVAFYIGQENAWQEYRAFHKWYALFDELESEGRKFNFQTKAETILKYSESNDTDVIVDEEYQTPEHINFTVTHTNDFKCLHAHLGTYTPPNAGVETLKAPNEQLKGIPLYFPLDNQLEVHNIKLIQNIRK